MRWTGHVRFPKTISDDAEVENVSSGCRPSPSRLLGVLYCQTENSWKVEKGPAINQEPSPSSIHGFLPFDRPLTCCFCTFDKESNPHYPSRASEVGTPLSASANRTFIAYSSRLTIVNTLLNLIRLPFWPST